MSNHHPKKMAKKRMVKMMENKEQEKNFEGRNRTTKKRQQLQLVGTHPSLRRLPKE